MKKRIVLNAASLAALMGALVAGPSFAADLNVGDDGRYGVDLEEVRHLPVVSDIDDIDVAGIGIELGDRGDVGVDLDNHNRLLGNLPLLDGLRLEDILGR